MLRVARKKAFCNVLGPGTRSVVWFYGCSKNCPGCIADPRNATKGYETCSSEELAEWVLGNPNIEGITLSGGEPFEQPMELLERFLTIVKKKSELSVLSYTGYRYEKLLGQETNKAVLRHIDVLIDGEYQIDQDRGQRWRGSENQRFHFLTSRYSKEEDKWGSALGREIEIELGIDGSLLISGVPPKNFIENLTEQLERQNISLDFSNE